MKLHLLTLITTLAFASSLLAQESVPLEEAQKIARKINEEAGAISDAALAIEPNLDAPQGIKGGEIGLIVVPDKKLSAEALGGAGTTPIAQLWTLGLLVAKDGKAIPSSELRRVTFHGKNEDKTVQLYFLGAQKSESGVDLVVFSKDKEPLLRVPAAKASGATQSLPIELSARKESEDSGTLTLNVLGQLKADLLMVKQ